MNKNKLIVIIFIIGLISFISAFLYNKFKNKQHNPDTLLQEGKYFADIIYAIAHDSVYNRDYLKNVFEKNASINKNILFLEYLAYFTRYFDYFSSLYLEEKYRKVLSSSIITNISDYLHEIYKESKFIEYFTHSFNKRANEFIKYNSERNSLASQEKMKITLNDKKIPQFLNMDGEPDFEFTKEIIKLLGAPIESFLAFEVYNTISTAEDVISKKAGDKFFADKFSSYLKKGLRGK